VSNASPCCSLAKLILLGIKRAAKEIVSSLVCAWVCPTLVITICLAQAPPRPDASSATAEKSFKRFLQTFDNDRAARYVAAFADLNGDGKSEAVVYLISDKWCGSGGCNTIVLTQDGGSWKILTSIAISRPPIRVLTHTTYGWRSIGVWVQGGGINPGYEAELRFDRKTYPSNPSVPPARPLLATVAGNVVISPSAKGIPLYP
jgi:hypothetical protein